MKEEKNTASLYTIHRNSNLNLETSKIDHDLQTSTFHEPIFPPSKQQPRHSSETEKGH